MKISISGAADPRRRLRARPARRHRKFRRYRSLRGGSRAAQRHFAAEAAHMLALRNRSESGLKAISPHAVIFGEAAGRLPNTTLFGVEGMKAETAVITFELEGIAVSSGAACSSGKVQPAHLLAATEMSPALVRGAVRVSLGWGTGEADIERFLAARRRLANALCRGHSIAA
jgi:cysteine desulfurase